VIQATTQRVLLRLATPKDAELTAAVLARAGIAAQPCGDLDQLVDALVDPSPPGAGALMLAEEALADAGSRRLADWLAAQPQLSDISVLLLARHGANSRAVSQVMEALPNVTVIERPVRVSSLVSTVRATLRARQRQYELRDVLDGLQAADRRKTEFLATLAHELRNPLAPIRTALTLLQDHGPDPRTAARHLELMRRQVDHMVRLVDDLMEVSRITRGKVRLQRVPVLLDTLLDDAVELSRPLVEAAGHDLVVERACEALVVDGDPVRLTQVFSNLLNNAAKYTPPGGRLHLSCGREGQEAVLRVIDSGAGIAPEMLASIFDMFVQVSGTDRAAQGGLGIGLTLVKSLVELHGGRVEAASGGLGRGATFTVRLPLAAAAAVAAPITRDKSGQAPAARPSSVLVVDDNQDAADSLGELLGAMGLGVQVAYSGEQALQVAAGRHFDVAVLDIGMPGMDGCDLARQLRARPGLQRLKLIALTGWGQDSDRARFASAGFDHHLLKPVDPGALLGLVQAAPMAGGRNGERAEEPAGGRDMERPGERPAERAGERAVKRAEPPLARRA
jgi:signal transduction histidine kinase/ActR/RegA family two-component response regulator